MAKKKEYKNILKELLEISYRIKWAESEKKIWIKAEKILDKK